jgi:hypothetical protein
MAPSDYYHKPPRPQQQQQPPQPYYQSYNPSAAPSIAPSYHTNPPSRTPSTRAHDVDPVSPFEAPFDDHVYPMGRPNEPQYDSQSSLGADSRYYGQGGRLEQSNPSFQDDIPLRDHPAVPAKDNNSTDHVYDAPAPALMEEGRRNRFSGLGMLRKPKGRIPWLVYILTTVQVAVFIAEIVKNGMYAKYVLVIMLTRRSTIDRFPD